MPRSEPAFARLFDGESARARAVAARLEGDALVIGEAGGEERIARALLTREASGGRITLHRSDRPDWRLIVSSTATGFDAVPNRHRFTATHARWVTGAGALLVAGGLVLWSFGNRALVWAAPLVPRTVAVGAGKPMADMIAGGDNRCGSEPGAAALRKLVSRVKPRWPVEAFLVRVGRSDGVNAFTLPGGQIVVLSGLIDAAQTPEEVAGVLAHEFGHVQKRHPNQALLRHFGFDVFAQGLGGNVGALAATGLFLRNSRAAEQEADSVALDLLREGGVSSAGLADFFARMTRDRRREPKSRLDRLAGLAATHPDDGTREARFRSVSGRYPAAPILSRAEWMALKRICSTR